MRHLLLVFLAVALCLGGSPLFAQTVNYHTTLFGRLDPITGTDIRYSALTGYAAPDGREYAILGGYDGTYIVDVTEKPIRQVAFVPGSPSIWREMKTYSHYAYVVTESSAPYAGLQIIDLAKLPASVELVGLDSTWFRTGHTITQEGDYLYVNGSNQESIAAGGTLIFKVSDDPAHPEIIGAYSRTYVHDCTVRNDTLYAAAIYDGELDIVYLGAKRDRVQYVTGIRYPGGGTHNCDLTTDGTYVMTTDEIHETPKTLKVWDIHDLNNISKVADYTPIPGETIHNVHIKGNLAYISWYSGGTRILDISDPRDPAQLGYYDTYDGISSSTIGNWEVYPYLPSGKILASDMLSGLFVFTFDGATKGKTAGSVFDQATGSPIANATIVAPEIGLTITTDAQGHYAFSGAVDTLDVEVSATAHRKGTGRIILSPSGSRQDFYLASFFSGVTGSRGETATDAVTMSPNPMERRGEMMLRNVGAQRHQRVELVDDLGRCVATIAEGAMAAGEHHLTVDVSGLPAGRYFWRVTDDDGKIRSGALVVAR
jgi:choice-of-anchor B domain-containing protein